MKPTSLNSAKIIFPHLTDEQLAAVASSATGLLVDARAGSGKTTMQIAYAAARKDKKGLYLAFGKAIQVEASGKLMKAGCSNTVAKTTHSLAYASFGAALARAGKLDRTQGGLRAAMISNQLGCSHASASAIRQIIINFMASSDDQIEKTHADGLGDVGLGSLVFAKKYWQKMIDLNDSSTQAVDDAYLKQWVMSKPKLDYDFILFDECQDANPLTVHLVNLQTHASRIYVGDPHQAIYGFRGAVNLMDELKVDDVMHLTRSFRFRPSIGVMATTFLKHWKNDPLPLIGMASNEPKPGMHEAWLSRTVAGLIETGVSFLKAGKRVHWLKGFESYRIKPLHEAAALYAGNLNNITDPVLKLMGSWDAYEQYAEASGDREAKPIIRIVNEHKNNTAQLLTRLARAQIEDPKDSAYTLTTAHQSKGLEWPIVRLNHDFVQLSEKDTGSWLRPDKVDVQELNLLYVALTRGQSGVVPNRELSKWLSEQPATMGYFWKPGATHRVVNNDLLNQAELSPVT